MIEEIKQFIIKVIGEIVTDINIDENTLLFEEDIMDSITILYLIEELENNYGIKIPLEEVTEQNFSTISKIAEFADELINRSK